MSAGTSATPSFSFSTLTCGTSYVLGVEAFDAAGNTSTRPAITATTSACADTTPPTAPSALAAGSVTRTSLVLSWTGSTDNVGVAGYRIFRDGVSAGTSATPSFSFSTLTCGTSYVLGVEVFDAAGNTSTRPAITATTSACADTTPPTAPSALAAGSVTRTSLVLSWTGSTDNVGVAGYRIFRDGVSAGTSATPSFSFSTLTCGTSYVLGVEAFDAAGNTSARPAITATTSACADTTPPTAPASFSAGTTGTTSIATSWAASTDNVGVAGYTLYRNGVSAGTATSPLFTFAGLTCGTSYTLGVEAFDAAGNVSPRASITASTSACPDVTAPSAPASFSAGTTGTTSIATSWASSTDNVGVAGYTLYRNGVSAGTATSPLFTFAGLTCGTSYTLGVEAFDAAGNVSPRTSITASTSACPDVTAPSAPTGLAAGTAHRSHAPVTWTASTDNVGVAGYRLFRDGVSAGTTTSTSFTFTGLSCGSSYVLGVEAFDAAGNTSARATITASTPACPDVTAPTAPSGLAATSAATSIGLSWAASTDNVGVTGYSLFLDGVSAGTTTTSSFSFAALLCGTSHLLGVQAFDAAGNVSAQTTLTAATAACGPDATKPSQPTGFVVATAGTNSITMTWVPSTDNVGVTGYNLYRSGVKQATTTATTFTYTGLNCTGAYSVGVEAFDAAGNVSARTTVTALTLTCPDTIAPSAPVGVVASAVNPTSIALTWNPSTDNIGVTGYSVFRAGVGVGTTATSSFTVTGLTCNTSYLLGVQAVDAAGNNSTRTSVTLTTGACGETVPPSAPSGLAATSAATSIGLSWAASTDNVGVTGYALFVDGVSAGTTTTTSFSFTGLGCGTSHVLGVQAFDAAGNISPRAAVTASTTACPDVTAPSTPTALTPGATTTTSIAASWAASTDNVGVTGYALFLDGVSAGTTTTTSFSFTGLGCGTSHVLGVQAFDAAGNVSPRATVTASTTACPDVTAPSTPTALAPGATTTTSIAASWTASTDNVGVTGYALFLDGVSAGTTTTTSFSFTGLGCGTSHVLGVQAFDAAGNVSPRAAVTASTTACPDVTAPSTPTALAPGASTTSVDRRLVDSVDRQRRRDRVRALPGRRERRHDDDDRVLVHGPRLRHELRARRAGLRRGGQRLAARHGHGLDLGLPGRDGAPTVSAAPTLCSLR